MSIGLLYDKPDELKSFHWWALNQSEEAVSDTFFKNHYQSLRSSGDPRPRLILIGCSSTTFSSAKLTACLRDIWRASFQNGTYPVHLHNDTLSMARVM
jgi:hypothetical protein